MKLKSFISSQVTEEKKPVRRQPFYMTLAQSADAAKRLEFEAKHLDTLIQIANASFEEYSMISSFRDVIKLHGASEGLMSCINADDQLARCLGIAIPEVTSVNAQAIGESCCEAIEEKLSCSCGLTCKFMKDLIECVNSFVSALTDNAICQKETLETVYEEIVKKVAQIDAVAFAKEEICGYAQPVFMSRVAAINEAISGLMESVDIISAEKVIPALQKLGFVVEASAQIRPETPAEAKATEPPKEEVMSSPVVEAEKSEEELAENVQAPAQAIPEPAVNTATDDVQSKEIAVLRWTPETIGTACNMVIGLLGRVADLTKLAAKVTAICGAAIQKCDAEGEKSPEVQAKLDGERRFAAFMSSALHILGSAINGLVDQCICMSTKLKKCECCCGDGSCKAAVPAIAVTQERPLAEACSKQGPRFYKKLKDEGIPPMTVAPKEEGTKPANPPAESGDSQPKVTQTTPPDQSMTVPEQPKPAEGAGDAKPAEQGSEPLKPVEPKQDAPVPTPKVKDENGLVEDPILAPTTNPVTPVKDPAPPAVPVAPVAPAPAAPAVAPAAPAEPITAPAATPAVAPTVPPAPAVVEDPIIAPVAKPEPQITQDNAQPAANPPAENGDKQPEVKQVTPPDQSMTVPEQPKPTGDVEPAAAPAENGNAQKKSEQPEKVETEQNPKVEQKPAGETEPIQHPENTVDAQSFRKLGSFWV